MTDTGTSDLRGGNPDYLRKIVEVESLHQIVDRVRRDAAEGEESPRTIVQCHGCFDIVHPGHIRYLRFARAQGDVLVVSITGDAQIDKGDQRPYIPQELRAENLAALEFVDFVVIDPNPTACRLLGRIRPDVYVKGQEYATSSDPAFLAERKVVESHGGRVIFSSGQVVFSSSRLIEAMPHSSVLAEQRMQIVCRRHGIDQSSVTALFDRMRGRRILVLGDTILERYVLCDASGVAGESPMMSLEELDSRDYLGGAAFAALLVVGLGGRATLVTSLGEDAASSWAISTLKDAGVEVRALHTRPELAVKTRFMVDDHKLFKVNRTRDCPLDSVGESAAAKILQDVARSADAAIFYDLGNGVITPGLLGRVGADLRQSISILAGGSAGPHGNAKAFRHFDLLCPSERQLRTAVNDFGSGLSHVAYRMLHETGAKHLLVALGKRGLVTFDRRSHDPNSPGWEDRLSSEHLPSFSNRVTDQLGEIESVLTAATLALSAGAGLMEAAYVAAAVASIQVNLPGLTAIKHEVVRSWTRHRAELIAPVRSKSIARADAILPTPRRGSPVSETTF
ncbi:MAG: adenylyltransferase/cytidyltransferase family protein [Planctomycetota bacterium]|nr:adenylyltransferase/cytidyltransferase family protein [Planctomycetota bacterium]